MIITILAVIVLLIFLLVSFGKKKQKQATAMVDQFYKMLELKDEKDASKLANAGILYSW